MSGIRGSSSTIKYYNRLFWLFVVSQVPYVFMTGNFGMNIAFSLGVTVALIDAWRRENYMAAFALLLASSLIIYDYYLLVPLMGLVMYVYYDREFIILPASAVLVVLYCYFTGGLLQSYSILGVLIWCLGRELRGPRLPRLVKYSIYPVHMILFVLVRDLLLK